MVEEWPLVGRQDELKLVSAVLGREDRAGIVLAGPAGVGKSRLAAECLALAARSGFVTLRAAASRSAASIPFGALAPLLPPAGGSSEGPAEVLARAVAAIAGRGDGRPVFLLVDDAHLLDEASATLLHQVAVTGAAFLVVTMRAGEALHDPIVALWKDGLAERFDVPPLAEPDVATLLERVLGGPVDGGARRRLWEVSGGNALFLREVLLAGVEVGVLREEGGVWRMAGSAARSPRLVELVEGRLAGLTDDERLVLELVAFGEPIGVTVLEALVPLDQLEALERKGLLAVETAGARLDARLTHPLHGEVLRARMPMLRARRVNQSLADAVASTGARRREDALRIATWRLDGGGQLDPVLMLTASAQAAASFDHVLAERLATAALDASGGTDLHARRQAGEALANLGRTDEAEKVFAGADPGTFATAPEGERALLTMARCDNLFWGLGRADDAIAVSREVEASLAEELWINAARCHRAGIEVQGGYLAEALASIEPLLDLDMPYIVAAAAIVAGPAHMLVGDAERAIATSERGYAAQVSLGDFPMVFHRDMHRNMQCLALMELGRIDDAEALARACYDDALAARFERTQAWFATMLARTLLYRGQVAACARLAREANALFQRSGQPGMSRLSLSVLAQASAYAGELDEAEAAAAHAEVVGSAARLFHAETQRARAWAAVTRGDTDGAIALFREAVATSVAGGERVTESAGLHDLARLGLAAEAAPRLAELAALVDGELCGIRAEHAAALAAGDGEALDAVAQRFEAIGALLWAAEATASAARQFRLADDARRAATLDRRAAALAARCEGARTPGLPVPSTAALLSDREREVAALAADGMPSRQIAERLYLSVRTVDNHLQRAYDKLGVASRADLADALGQL